MIDINFVINYLKRLPPAGDQGIRPTCVSFSLTACHEYHYGMPIKHLSKDSLHWGCVQKDGSALNGVLIQTAIDVLEDQGQCLEIDWPYNGKISEKEWEEFAYPKITEKSNFKVKKGRLLKIDGINSLENILINFGPLCLAIPIWKSFFYPKKGLIPFPNEIYEEFRGYHAVTIVGMSKSGHVLIRNSWGKTWGIDGHAAIEFRYIKDHAVGVYALIRE